MSNGAPVTHDVWNRTGWIGHLYVRDATCQTRQGWRILPDAIVETAPEGVDAIGRPRGEAPVKGWAVALSSTDNGKVNVLMARCWVRGNPWNVLKEVLGLPVSVPWRVSLGSWAASRLVPDGPGQRTCRELGVAVTTLGVDRRGRLTARSDGVGPIHLRTDKTHYSRYEVVPFQTLGRNVGRPDR